MNLERQERDLAYRKIDQAYRKTFKVLPKHIAWIVQDEFKWSLETAQTIGISHKALNMADEIIELYAQQQCSEAA